MAIVVDVIQMYSVKIYYSLRQSIIRSSRVHAAVQIPSWNLVFFFFFNILQRLVKTS